MKKLIALATLLFAFTISANAQDKKVAPGEAAKTDLTALQAKLKLSDQTQHDIYTLLVMKHEQLANNPQMTATEKENLSKKIEAKILSGLDDVSKKTLLGDPALLKQLTH